MLAIPLVVKSLALATSFNPSCVTFWLCDKGSEAPLMGLSFLSCKLGIRTVPTL